MAKQTETKTVPTMQLTVRSGADIGSGGCRRLRQRGMVPAVVYGRGVDSAAVYFDIDEYRTLQKKHQTHGLLRLEVGTEATSGIIKDIQYDVFMEHMLHVDFQRVQRGEIVTVEVRIDLRGTAPGATHGGILGQLLHDIEIECPVESIPDSIEVNVSSLGIGQHITIGDLVLPESCKATGDADLVVVQVSVAMSDDELESKLAAASGDGQQPKVIGAEEEAEDDDE